LLAGGLVGGKASNADPLFTGGGSGFSAVVSVVPFLFVGFDVIPQSAEELNMPPRRMGVMIIVSVAAATLWYIMVILTNASSMP
ncbi:amino acid permease, partial [Planococcus sp. SIMBA_143]